MLAKEVMRVRGTSGVDVRGKKAARNQTQAVERMVVCEGARARWDERVGVDDEMMCVM